jgi:hypothetical protein
MIYRILLGISIGTLSIAMGAESDYTLVVHDNARVTFSRALSLFDQMRVVREGDGSVACTEDASCFEQEAPATDLLARLDALEHALASLNTNNTSNNEQAQLAGTLHALQEALNALDDRVAELSAVQSSSVVVAPEGFETSLDGVLVPQLLRLEEKIASVQKSTQTALQNLPIINATSDTSGMSVLVPFLQPSHVANRAAKEEKEKEYKGACTRLPRSVAIAHDVSMMVDRSITINGQGETLSFAKPDASQIVIKKGATLRFTNIFLNTIHADTFVLEEGATLIFGENTRCLFAQDWDVKAGAIVCEGDETVVRWQGVDAATTITLSGSAHITLNTATLALSSLTLKGGDAVSCSVKEKDGVIQHGALGLCGSARVLCRRQLATGCVVSGADNACVFAEQQTFFKGPFLYMPNGVHECALLCSEQSAGRMVMVVEGAAFSVASTGGRAVLSLGQGSVCLQAQGAQAPLVIGNGGSVAHGELFLAGAPIFDVTASSPVTQGGILKSDQGWQAKLPDAYPRVTTALHLQAPIPAASTPSVSEEVLVRGGFVSMPRMKRVVRIEQGGVTDWDIDSASHCSLHLQGNAVCEQSGEPFMVKPTDTITARKKNNVISFAHDMSWRGDCVVEDGGELICEVARGATLFFAPKVWRLGVGAQLHFRGAGRVVFAGSVTCQGPDRGASAQLIFESGIAARIKEDMRLTLEGSITLLCDDHAQLRLSAGSRLWCGTAESVGAQQKIVLDRGGMLQCSSNASGKTARLSCAYASYEVLCMRGGSIRIGDGGMCEWNIRDGAALPGVCREVTCIERGCIELETPAAQISIGRNTHDQTCMFELEYGSIGGAGLVASFAPSKVVGVCQKKSTDSRVHRERVTMRQLAGFLMNCCDILSSALYFVTSEGSYLVQTISGAVVPLAAGEYVVSDNAQSGTVLCKRKQQGGDRLFEILANGSRKNL